MKKLLSLAVLMCAFIGASITMSVAVNAQSKNLNDRIPLNPKVITGKLDNGLTYYVLENKKPENRAEVWVKFKVGSVQEEEYQRGLAHFIEHMCFNGTKHFPKDSLLKFLESTGVRFGADINAHTSFDEITYTLTLPTDVPGMMDNGLQVLEDWAMNVSFDSLEIEKERGVILEEERMRDANAQGRLSNKHLPRMLAGSQYAVRMPIGLTEVIKTAQRQAFVDYYTDWFRPELTAVILVGDFNAKEMVPLIKKHFDGFKFQGKGSPKPRVKMEIPDNKEPIISIAYDKELPYSNATLFIKHHEKDQTTYGAYRDGLKERLFETMFIMRLQEITQEPKPPFLMAQGGMGNFVGDLHCFMLTVIPNNDGFSAGLERGLAEMFRIDQHGFTPTELERAKESILASYEKSYNERDKSENYGYVRELASYFEGKESAPGIEVEYEIAKEYLQTITIEEVNKMVAENITPENVIFQVSLPENSTEKPTEADILAIFKKAETAKYDAYVDDLGDAKLMKELPKPGKITSEKKLPNFDITEMKLSNGARVLLKPTDFKNDQILFQCWADGGSSLYPDAEYQVASSADEIVDNNGLGEFSAIKLGKLLQSKMIRLSPYVASYEQGMQGSLTPKDAEIFFQLLNMQFTQPRKDNDAFDSWKAKTIEVLRGRDNDPMSAYRDTLNAVLSGYNVRSKTITRDEVDAMSQDRAFAIYKERFADASNFTFVFVGAFKIDAQFKAYLEQYIASLPATNKKEKGKDLGMKPMPGVVNKIVKRGIEPKAQVGIYIDNDFPTFSSEEKLKINALSEIATIKIRESLREDKGGVYSPYGRLTTGYFPRKYVRAFVTYSCDPARAQELIEATKEVFAELQKNITAEDLTKAKEMMKKDDEVNSQDNSYWLGTITNFDQTGRDLAFLKDYKSKVDKLTTKDMVETAKKYLNYNTNFITVIQMPEDDDE
ncbi:MAG: insulinase family protein [Ignavibacteria bacterium]|jgi:zinc protease|nr:insulinase family protein [Ignavibacteria bacterium]